MPQKLQFRPPKMEEQEKKKPWTATRNATKWTFKVFSV